MKAMMFEWRHHLACLAAVSTTALSLASNESPDLFHVALRAFSTYAISALLLGGWRFAWVVCRTFWRDIRGILVFIQMKLIMRKHVRNGENIPSLWRKTAETFGEKVCFYFENLTWSFNEVR